MPKQPNTTCFIQDDPVHLHRSLEKMGFRVTKLCIHGTFYDRWCHENVDLTICTSYTARIKRSRLLRQKTNMHLHIKSNLPKTVRDYYATQLQIQLVELFGGYMKYHYGQNNYRILSYASPVTVNSHDLLNSIQHLINRQASHDVSHM